MNGRHKFGNHTIFWKFGKMQIGGKVNDSMRQDIIEYKRLLRWDSKIMKSGKTKECEKGMGMISKVWGSLEISLK